MQKVCERKIHYRIRTYFCVKPTYNKLNFMLHFIAQAQRNQQVLSFYRYILCLLVTNVCVYDSVFEYYTRMIMRIYLLCIQVRRHEIIKQILY